MNTATQLVEKALRTGEAVRYDAADWSEAAEMIRQLETHGLRTVHESDDFLILGTDGGRTWDGIDVCVTFPARWTW